ncbi:hypothetical protein [Amycolatopsis thermoflava]|uniref:hypothetical protein n=1 Tax=Amycolatopsis thermoflava TaxID=84480 RepID=UPI00365B21AE
MESRIRVEAGHAGGVDAFAQDGHDLRLEWGAEGVAEALLAATAYRGTDIAEALRGCVSGRELTLDGHGRDVELAAQVDVSTVAPVLVGDLLEAA